MENITIEQWVAIITSVVTIARIITTLTPNEHDNKIVNSVLKILDVLGIGVGKNKK